MKCGITLSANAGISLIINNESGLQLRLWIDALHEQHVNDFSTLSETIIDRMLKCEDFYYPDAIIYTHCHSDHFSEYLTRNAMMMWPDALVVLPEKKLEGQMLLSEDTSIEIKGAKLDFMSIPHEGEEFKDVSHFSCLVRMDDVSILITGDAELGSQVLNNKLEERGMTRENSPDIVIVDFPWITLKKGRDALDEWLWPKHLVVDHLPFEEEDDTGFNMAAKRSAKELQHAENVVIMNEALQQEVFEI